MSRLVAAAGLLALGRTAALTRAEDTTIVGQAGKDNRSLSFGFIYIAIKSLFLSMQQHSKFFFLTVYRKKICSIFFPVFE